jgi:tetratricopeptide (TPR) repeat protein
MKQLILLLSLLPFFTITAQQELFDQANENYTQEQYAEAVAMYDSIHSLGLSSAELYYNLGNAHYKMGHISSCILNYERALQLAPNDKDITYNLELVQQHVVDKIEMLDVFFLKKMLYNTRITQTSNTWAKLSLVSFAATLFFLLFFFLSRRTLIKRITFYLSILTLIITLVSLSFSSNVKHDMTSHESAIVFSPTVTVKSSPNESGTKIFVLHEGTKVQIVDRLGEWVEILLSDGNKGWMKSETIEEI